MHFTLAVTGVCCDLMGTSAGLLPIRRVTSSIHTHADFVRTSAVRSRLMPVGDQRRTGAVRDQGPRIQTTLPTAPRSATQPRAGNTRTDEGTARRRGGGVRKPELAQNDRQQKPGDSSWRADGGCPHGRLHRLHWPGWADAVSLRRTGPPQLVQPALVLV